MKNFFTYIRNEQEEILAEYGDAITFCRELLRKGVQGFLPKKIADLLASLIAGDEHDYTITSAYSLLIGEKRRRARSIYFTPPVLSRAVLEASVPILEQCDHPAVLYPGLRRSLCQAAWAASHTKETYLAARFRRLAARKGKKRAIVAVAHTILVSLYHMLKNKQPYRELGADFLDRRNAEHVKRYLLKRLERLGLQVTVRSSEDTAALLA